MKNPHFDTLLPHSPTSYNLSRRPFNLWSSTCITAPSSLNYPTLNPPPRQSTMAFNSNAVGGAPQHPNPQKSPIISRQPTNPAMEMRKLGSSTTSTPGNRAADHGLFGAVCSAMCCDPRAEIAKIVRRACCCCLTCGLNKKCVCCTD